MERKCIIVLVHLFQIVERIGYYKDRVKLQNTCDDTSRMRTQST